MKRQPKTFADYKPQLPGLGLARLALGLVLCTALNLTPGLRAQTLTANLTLQQDPPSIWKDGIGNGFRADTLDAGFLVGAGFGIKEFGSSRYHDLAISGGHFGWIFTDVVCPDKFFRGNWQWWIDAFSGGQYDPKTAYLAGGCTGVEYDFATGTRWVPFAAGGVGVSGTNIGRPDLSNTFEFNVEVAGGTHYFLTQDLAATFVFHWMHFSDAGMTHPNYGVNTQMFEGGLTWFF
jgi:hypothetical protein